MYLQLLHQDGVNDADPLYMILNINTSSRKRFSALLDAANRGKGLSQLPYWEVPDDDPNGVAAAHDEADASEEPADQETEDAQNADKTPEKLDPATGDDPSTEDVSQATDNDVSTLQGNATTTISSSKITDSRTSKAEASRAASDSNSAPLLNSTQSDTIPAPEIGKELQDPTSSHHGVNHTAVSPHDNFAPDLDESGVEEGDLIDYEDGDEPAIQDSTGSSTLAGDDDANAAIGQKTPFQFLPQTPYLLLGLLTKYDTQVTCLIASTIL